MPTLFDLLGGANLRLSHWLDGINIGNGRPILTPEIMAALLSELLRVGAALRAEPIPAKGVAPELDAELETYRRRVEKLRDLLPAMHSHLLAERARWEAQRSRVQSAAQWARASRQTF